MTEKAVRRLLCIFMPLSAAASGLFWEDPGRRRRTLQGGRCWKIPVKNTNKCNLPRNIGFLSERSVFI